MRKEASFDDHRGDGWPDPSHVKACLLDPKLRSDMFAKGRDGGNFSIDGLYGTLGLPARGGLICVALYMYMNPEHGVTLQYSKWDGRIQKKETLYSYGDLKQVRRFVHSLHGTPLSLGLFIPFEQGTLAVTQYLESEGELPTAIGWIRGTDLPLGTFPET